MPGRMSDKRVFLGGLDRHKVTLKQVRALGVDHCQSSLAVADPSLDPCLTACRSRT